MEINEIIAVVVMMAGLLYLSIEDIRNKKISLIIIVIIGILMTGLSVWEQKGVVYMLTGIIPGAFATIFSILSKGGLGLGDALLLMATGVYLGLWDGLAVLMMGLLLSSALGILLLILKKAHLKTALPFVPFYLGGFVLWEMSQKI